MKRLGKTVDEIKNQILDAAFARFGQYGLGKTTMAEIAKDCDMSAALLAAISLGIVVDGTVHLLSKYIQRGLTPEQAIPICLS